MPKRGENIFKRKDGRWEARYIHHYEGRKAVYRYLYGKTYAEVREKKLAELSRPEQYKTACAKRTAVFDEIAALWLSDIKHTVKESTYARYYRCVEKYLLPLLKDRPLAKRDRQFYRFLTDKLLEHGGSCGKPLSPKTVTDILGVLKAILRCGEENGYPVPSCDCIKYPPRKSTTVSILSESERIKIEQLLTDPEDTLCLGILFTLYTGVRIGELCGLRWEDIDLASGIVHIRRTVERIADLDRNAQQKTKVIINEPKTDNAVRVIPLPSFLVDRLSDRRKSDDCYLLTGTPKPTEPHQYYVRYRKFLRRNGIDDHTFHALRHTFATRCVELGFDTKSLSEILGHSNVTTTLRFYVHPTIRQKKAQMELLVPSHS